MTVTAPNIMVVQLTVSKKKTKTHKSVIAKVIRIHPLRPLIVCKLLWQSV